jgi:hypothetical protein
VRGLSLSAKLCTSYIYVYSDNRVQTRLSPTAPTRHHGTLACSVLCLRAGGGTARKASHPVVRAGIGRHSFPLSLGLLGSLCSGLQKSSTSHSCASSTVSPHSASSLHAARAHVSRTAMRKLRIVACGISGGRSLTRPLRDARRFPSTQWYPVPGATRTTLGFGICPSFKDRSLSRRAKP